MYVACAYKQGTCTPSSVTKFMAFVFVVFPLWTKQLASNAEVMNIDFFYDIKPVVIAKDKCSAFC
jgi:hypothetical protein